MKANDEVQGIFIRKMDYFGEAALNAYVHKKTTISIKVTSCDDSYGIQFPEPVTRGELSCLLRELADRVSRGV